MAVKEQKIAVDAVIDGETFSEYALFDVLARQKRWRRPLLFAAIFTAFSLLAFSRRGETGQAALLGGVLLGVGWILPLGYLLSFFLSVRRQSRTLDGKRAAYTLELGEDGLTVTKGEQILRVAWKDLVAAYRLKRSICLYTDALHAFLLPRSCGEACFEAAWARIRQKLDPGKCRDRAR